MVISIATLVTDTGGEEFYPATTEPRDYISSTEKIMGHILFTLQPCEL
jgi:hypothetical protein